MLSLIPLSLIASTTIGIAAVNLSKILENWYEAEKQQTMENIKNKVITTRQDQLSKLIFGTVRKFNEAKGVIAQAGSATAQDIRKTIQLHNGEYLRQIEQTKQELMAGKGSEPFEHFVETKKTELSYSIHNDIVLYLSQKVEQLDSQSNPVNQVHSMNNNINLKIEGRNEK